MFKSASSGISGSNTARNARDAFEASDQNYNVGNRFVDSLDEAAGFQNKYGGYGAMDDTIHAQEKTIKRLNAEEEAYRDYAAQIASKNTGHTLEQYDSYANAYSNFVTEYGKTHKDADGNAIVPDTATWVNEQDLKLGSGSKAVQAYADAQYKANVRHEAADVEKGKLDRNKQAYAARTDKGHGGHK